MRALMSRGNRAPFELVDLDREFSNAFDEMNRMMGNVFKKDPFFTTVKSSGFPKVNIRRDGDDAVFEVAIPYYDPDLVCVTLENGILGVSTIAVKEAGVYEVQEIARRAFQRSWPVNQDTRKEDITAEYDKGVLFIRVKGQYKVSKAETKEEVRIEVRKKS